MYESATTNIMVKNVKETVKFYEGILGFKSVVEVPEGGEVLNFAIVAKDKISIMFQEQENLLSEYPSLATGDIVPTFTLFITVDDVAKLYEDLKDEVELAQPLHKTFYGREEFAIFDNNRNVLTIAQ